MTRSSSSLRPMILMVGRPELSPSTKVRSSFVRFRGMTRTHSNGSCRSAEL